MWVWVTAQVGKSSAGSAIASVTFDLGFIQHLTSLPTSHDPDPANCDVPGPTPGYIPFAPGGEEFWKHVLHAN
jgi:hypothetical protein